MAAQGEADVSHSSRARRWALLAALASASCSSDYGDLSHRQLLQRRPDGSMVVRISEKLVLVREVDCGEKKAVGSICQRKLTIQKGVLGTATLHQGRERRLTVEMSGTRKGEKDSLGKAVKVALEFWAGLDGRYRLRPAADGSVAVTLDGTSERYDTNEVEALLQVRVNEHLVTETIEVHGSAVPAATATVAPTPSSTATTSVATKEAPAPAPAGSSPEVKIDCTPFGKVGDRVALGLSGLSRKADGAFVAVEERTSCSGNKGAGLLRFGLGANKAIQGAKRTRLKINDAEAVVETAAGVWSFSDEWKMAQSTEEPSELELPGAPASKRQNEGIEAAYQSQDGSVCIASERSVDKAHKVWCAQDVKTPNWKLEKSLAIDGRFRVTGATQCGGAVYFLVSDPVKMEYAIFDQDARRVVTINNTQKHNLEGIATASSKDCNNFVLVSDNCIEGSKKGETQLCRLTLPAAK